MDNSSILIVGLGLIGGSYARGLHACGYRVSALDTDEDSIRYAREEGFIAEGAVYDSALVRRADTVIFGLYPAAIEAWLREHQGDLQPGALLTDVSGVKRGMVETVQSILRKDVEFLASHPMAGREVSGVRNSSAALFCGANFIITPTARNTPAAEERLRILAQALGFGNITVLSPEEHDVMIGYVSQLTHAIAVSLMNANDDPRLREYTGDSFRDLTRIAKINEVLWSELFLSNRDVLMDQIDRFTDALQHLRSTLEAEDRDELRRLFIRSTQRRKIFDRET